MSERDQRLRAWGLALIVVGLVLVAGGLTLVPDILSTEYYHSASEMNREDIRDHDPVYEFDELSPETQSVFLAALEDSDGRHTVTDDKPPEFDYPGDVNGYQVVVYEESYYGVSTSRESSLGILRELVALVLGILGTFTAATGVWLRRESSRAENGDTTPQ